MLGSHIDIQVAIELVAQTVFGEHATDSMFEDTFGVRFEQFGGSSLALATGIASITLIDFIGHLVAGEDDFLGVDDNDVVAAVDVRGEGRFGFPSEDVGDTGSQASYGLVGGIDQHPLLFDSLGVGRYGFVT